MLQSSLVTASLLVVAGAYKPRHMMDNRERSEQVQGVVLQNYPAPRFVQQEQDHFDEQNEKTWLQAYYVNDSFWAGAQSGAPVFLCVGGEGPPVDGSAVVNSLHCNVAVEWAQEKKALMFALEHRYYGCHNMSACPVENFKEPKTALKYLSSRQAVEDIANFVRNMNAKYQLSPANKWITWGGSYPGMLAGFSRLKHPDLIHAAVASSAPVHAKLNMFEYNDAVAAAYAVEDNFVGGSPACQAAIRRGHEQAASMLKNDTGIEALEKMLGLSAGSLATRDQQVNLIGYGLAEFPSQSNDPACKEPACNIAAICKIMANSTGGDELQRLVAVRHAQQGQLRSSDALDSLPDFWFYQTCLEFGFYQTCEVGSQCFFVQGLVGLKEMADGCNAYGQSIEDVSRNINETNLHYGGLQPSGPDDRTLGSCVLWPNGEVDPWSTLSILESPGSDQPVLWVPGASHHSWTHPSDPTDQPSVISARSSIRKTVEAFLAQESCSTKFSSDQTVFVV